MALPAMLSALKELILDIDELPPTESERRVAYRELFPTLSEEENEDLAKIPPEKLKIYTTTIFTGESKVLGNHFRASIALVRKHWKEVTGQKFNIKRFTRRLHKSRPWKGNTTQGLAENYLAHIQQDIPKLLEVAPQISDLAELEYYNLLIKRHPDDEMTPADSLSIDELAKLSVAELLQLQFWIPSCVRFEELEFDAPGIWNYFQNNEQNFPESIVAETVFIIGARTVEHLPKWERIDKQLWSALKEITRSKSHPLETLAEKIIANAKDGSTEEEIFVDFISLVARLISAGILIVKK